MDGEGGGGLKSLLGGIDDDGDHQEEMGAQEAERSLLTLIATILAGREPKNVAKKCTTLSNAKRPYPLSLRLDFMDDTLHGQKRSLTMGFDVNTFHFTLNKSFSHYWNHHTLRCADVSPAPITSRDRQGLTRVLPKCLSSGSNSTGRGSR